MKVVPVTGEDDRLRDDLVEAVIDGRYEATRLVVGDVPTEAFLSQEAEKAPDAIPQGLSVGCHRVTLSAPQSAHEVDKGAGRSSERLRDGAPDVG